MAKPKNENDQLKVMEELRDIRALLMLLVLKIGGTTEEVAAAMGVTNQRVSQMIPASKIKKLKLEGSQAKGGD